MSDRVYPPAEGPNQAKREGFPVSPEGDEPSTGAGGTAGAPLGGSATQAAVEGHPLAEGKTAGEHPASQAVVGRAKAPDGEVSPR